MAAILAEAGVTRPFRRSQRFTKSRGGANIPKADRAIIGDRDHQIAAGAEPSRSDALAMGQGSRALRAVSDIPEPRSLVAASGEKDRAARVQFGMINGIGMHKRR